MGILTNFSSLNKKRPLWWDSGIYKENTEWKLAVRPLLFCTLIIINGYLISNLCSYFQINYLPFSWFSCIVCFIGSTSTLIVVVMRENRGTYNPSTNQLEYTKKRLFFQPLFCLVHCPIINCVSNTIMVTVSGNLLRNGFYFRNGVTHCNAGSCIFDHCQIIALIPNRHNFCWR